MLMMSSESESFFGAVYVLLTGLTVRQREVSLSVRRAQRYGTRNQREIETRRSVNDRLLGPMAARLAGITMKLMPKTNTDQVSNTPARRRPGPHAVAAGLPGAQDRPRRPVHHVRPAHGDHRCDGPDLRPHDRR